MSHQQDLQMCHNRGLKWLSEVFPHILFSPAKDTHGQELKFFSSRRTSIFQYTAV